MCFSFSPVRFLCLCSAHTIHVHEWTATERNGRRGSLTREPPWDSLSSLLAKTLRFFLVKHLKKKLFNVKRAQFCFSRAFVELEEVFSCSWAFAIRNFVAQADRAISPRRDRLHSSTRSDLKAKVRGKVDSLWEFVKVIGSKKCFKEFVFFLREVSQGFRHERGEDKNCDGIIVEKNKVCERMWKRTHRAGRREKEVAKEKSKPTPENFYSVISKIAFSVLSSFPPTRSHSLTPTMSKNQKKECLRIFFWKKTSASTIVCAALRIEENSFRKTSRIFHFFSISI